jgi:hypothetical protein
MEAARGMRIVSKKGVIYLAITAFWLVMMGLLARREMASMPAGLEGAGGAGRGAQGAELPQHSRLGIFLNGQRIGMADSSYLPQSDRSAIIRTYVRFTKAAELGIPIEATGEIVLDADRKLSRFHATFGSGGLSMALRGTVIGRIMEIAYNIGGQTSRQVVPFQGDAFFSSSVTPLMGGLKVAPGEKRPLALWNPLMRQMHTAWVENMGKTRILWHGRWRNVDQLRLSYYGMALSSWVTESGDVLRQEAPLGLVLEKEE